MVAAVNYICDFGAVPRSTRGSLDFGAITPVQRVWAKFSETVGFWRVSGNPPKVDVRGIQPARSSHNADFAGLNDLREIALAEVEICPDDGGSVALGRIEQID